MGFVNLTCSTCKGTGHVRGDSGSLWKCLFCEGSGHILVHANSISGNRANKVITDDPWGKVWEQLDLFDPPE